MDGFLKRENLTTILSVWVYHFTKQDFKRDLQVYEFGLGDIRFIRKSQSNLNVICWPGLNYRNFWHGSGEIGTGPKKKGSARIKFAV